MSADPTESAAPRRLVRGPGLGRLWMGQVPYTLVLTGVVGGLVLFALHYFRKGATLVAIAVLCGALARLVLPGPLAGMLATRKKWLDVLMMASCAVAIAFVAWVVPAK